MERKKTAAESVPVENDKQFLERSGASTQIRDVLSKILENRPEDPVSFLADHFEALGDKVDKVGKAAQHATQTHYTKPAFTNNVKTAYEILGQTKVTMAMDRRSKAARKEPGKQVRGINGNTYMEMLHIICKTFPPTVRDRLLRKIRCRDYEVVSYDVFRSAVFTCLVLKDFLKQAEELYQSLDGQKSGKVDRTLCDTVTQQLQEAVSSTTSSSPMSVLQAGYTLGPKKIHSSLSSAFFKGGGDKRTVTQDDFVINAAESFLTKVRDLDGVTPSSEESGHAPLDDTGMS